MPKPKLIDDNVASVLNPESGCSLSPTALNWLYIDINSYFATIEQQVDPSIRNKPVVVVPVLSNATCAIAASSEAKRLGIRCGTRIYEAKKLCPELICVLARHDVYVEYHKKIFAEVEKHLHVDHIFSIDEAACKLTGELQNETKAIALAKQIKTAIKQNVGEYISCSIGIAPNRYLAKIATDMQKPDGLVVIKPEDLPNKLYSLKLKDLPGVGRGNYSRLTSCGIATVEQLYKFPPKHLRKIWGNIWGEKIYYLLRGADLPLELTKRGSISHSRVLAPNLRTPENARGVALSLLLRAAARLRAKELYTSNIILSLKTITGRYLVVKIKTELTQDDITLSQGLLKNFDELIANNINNINNTNNTSSTTPNNPLIFKKISIALINLEIKRAQLSFSDFTQNRQNTGILGISNLIFQNNTRLSLKTTHLSKAIDYINNKYGRNTVALGQLPKAHNKQPVVAFGYIPEAK